MSDTVLRVVNNTNKAAAFIDMKFQRGDTDNKYINVQIKIISGRNKCHKENEIAVVVALA